MRILTGVVALIVFISACQSKEKAQIENQSSVHKVVVQEVLHVNEYTYLRILEDGNEKWIAAPTVQAEIGKTYYFKNGMEMSNFESKELNRNFETIYFVDRIDIEPNLDVITEIVTPNNIDLSKRDSIDLSQKATKPLLEKEDVKIDPVKGIITIAELYKNGETYESKTIRVRGKVTKFNPAIMGKNWIHIQDGTDNNGEFDLTLTTKMEVKVGDVITAKGKVSLNKDFGYGYSYKLIIEDAVLVK